MASTFDNLEAWRRLLEQVEQVERSFADVMTVGSGPFPEEAFDALLREHDLNVFGIYNEESYDTLVVGRDEWDAEGLDALIDKRRGLRLKVYSQEMLLFYLMTAQDPYNLPDILPTFAAGHPALEYLRNGGFNWPTTTMVPTRGGPFALKRSPPQGVLGHLGYRTGRQGLGETDRREVLKRAFTRKLPFVESEVHMAEWGKARSAERLKKIANTLAALTRNDKRVRTRDLSLAIAEREADLEWLKDTYYHGRFSFQWPSTYVD